MPKPPEPEAPPAKGAKPAKGGKAAAVETPPPPPPLDEDELKRLTKLQNAVNVMYKKKRERPLVRDTPPATADSLASKRGESVAGSAAGDHGADNEGAATPAAAPPPVPDEPGIVKPADLDPELWLRVLKLRDERIETEEALAGVNANIEVAEARARNLTTLRNVTGYSQDAAKFAVEAAKNDKGPVQPKPPQTPQTPSGGARRNSNRPPSQLLRR